MANPRHVAVIDIGKTNAKVALVDLDAHAEIAVCRRANAVLPGPPYPHYDTDGLWQFILDSLGALHRTAAIDAITVTTHGASAALLDADGKLAAPVLDYEHDGPDSLAADYDALRPDFAETGSPRLPMGLNLAAQLFWQFRSFPEISDATKTILTYPQYWVFRLTGRAVSEVTSLGCHTDLWCPTKNRYSSLVERQGWSALMAPVARATDRIGPVLPEIAETCGLSPDVPVFCGIHDSNASLYAHLATRPAPFSVVSTGTWVISMAIGGKAVTLDPARDTLINVNALGDPVPSARFMGGREFELMTRGHTGSFDAADIEAVLARDIQLMPAVETRSGPFQGRRHSWSVDEASLTDGARFAALSYYLALMTATGLDIVGAAGEVLVEGPFGDNCAFLDMLASATGRPVRAVSGTGTSIGAALLTVAARQGEIDPHARARTGSPALAAYATRWRNRVKSTTPARPG
ncbi:FGGY-family carbohydrate kinase [Rhizobium halophytocola]|uniref:Sugar (Pentulose or hexulose) kinase n=1 Tax=Rhizobium halophytocola TaxID=735519 RepID=A0ABS4DV00_9HYPH|nr:FGGY-family carbohydrate kinase [Rhizobium halophytocola]MBP1849519.1 sugar (pentulose or hexulose) kinase [Rhizobium halophytocola]